MSQLLSVDILSEDSKMIADSYGITANGTIAGEVTSILRSCFSARYQLSKSYKEDNDQNYTDTIHESSLFYEGLSLCGYVDKNVLGDIAGIGNAARTIHMKAKERALPRLAAALVEFQKAQCYFMIAVQIAAMVTISDGRLQSTSLQQLYNNWVAVGVISGSGFLPVTFNLLCLQSTGKRSWYLTLLSTITVEGMKAANYRFLSPWTLTRTDGNTGTNDQMTPEHSRYELKPINNDYSMRERSRSGPISGYLAARDEDFEDKEEQQYMDTMAQRLL
ncbi:MAG: hypothetical protein Q9191_001676 [Dirinaria sp. TL-2023a]